MTKMCMMTQENVQSLPPNARYGKLPPRKNGNDTSFQDFMAGIAQMTVFCVITPCGCHPNK